MASKRPAPSPGAAVAAVAVAGAAAAGAKLVRERIAPDRAGEPDRVYRLRRDEFVPDGIRRIARGQLDDAHEQLDGASKRSLGEAVHETRKHLKRLRASLRLTRDALGKETYERENTAFRMAGRRLSAGRDAAVLVQTLDALRERFADELEPDATAALREQLEEEHGQALAAMREDGGHVGAALVKIDDARARIPAWTFESDGFDALAPGMKRIYRRGRKRMRAARSDPTPENLHEARKRVKDLWHTAQIMRPAAPKRMKRLGSDAHDVSNLLGDDHDLAVLREYVERQPRSFEDDDRRQALLAVIDRRRGALQRKALKRGRRLYKRSPKAFVAKIERGWRKRVGERPPPVAG
ncbi:MAG: CHAD domain-containing protein [Actinomycetota bacterium]|nr:CHAD domain-containing protein [Actinomycetota bacterium]